MTAVDEHSIQAPFAYRFYTQLKQLIQSTVANNEIEHSRNLLLQDNSIITGKDYGAGSKLKNATTVSSIAKKGISSQKDCIFLQSMAKLCEIETCVELGTSLGVASAYIASASNVRNIYSLEGNEALVVKAKQLFARLNQDKVKVIPGNIDIELPLLLSQIKSVDMAIIDANHTKKALLHYYQLLQPKMTASGIIFIDDIRWSNEMYAGWKALILKQEVRLSMEFANFGLLFFKKVLSKQHYVLTI